MDVKWKLSGTGLPGASVLCKLVRIPRYPLPFILSFSKIALVPFRYLKKEGRKQKSI